MNKGVFRLTSLILFVVLGMVVSGCGSSATRATGKITEKGAPLKLSDKGVVQLRFLGAKPEEYYQADVRPDGTFTVVGPDSRGIPPGTYKVAVKVLDPYGPKAKDRYNNKYADTTTTMQKEIKGNEEITIDLGS